MFAPLRDYLVSRAERFTRRARRLARILLSSGARLDLKQFYGQTENCALTAAQSSGDVKLNTVGKLLPGVEIKIDDNGKSSFAQTAFSMVSSTMRRRRVRP